MCLFLLKGIEVIKPHKFLMQKKKDHYTSEDQSMDSKIQNTTSEPLYLTYTQLQEATNGFSKERRVGEGAHGKVYRVSSKAFPNGLQLKSNKPINLLTF